MSDSSVLTKRVFYSKKNYKRLIYRIIIPIVVVLLILIVNYFGYIPYGHSIPVLKSLPHSYKTFNADFKTNPHKQETRVGNLPFTYGVINGYILGIVNVERNEHILLYLSNGDGTPFKDPLIMAREFKPVVASEKEKEIKATDLKKNDFVIVSYNKDIKTNKYTVTGIRVTR